MTFDMNNAEPQKTNDLIPDGTFAKLIMTVRPGGLDGEGEIDRGLLKASGTPGSDVRSLDCEFTVAEGPLARRKFWQMFTVSGGKLDEKGQSIGWRISKSTFRAMIDSALGLDPNDLSDAAKAKRVLRGLADLNTISFVGKIKIEPNNDPRYGDGNKLDRVVLPNEPEWRKVMDGEAVPASPSNRPRATTAGAPAQGGAKPAAAATPAPAWQRPAPAATPAPATTAPAAAPVATKPAAGPAWLNG